MKPSLKLALGGLLVAALSLFIGAAAAFAWLARPLEKWGVQFSETYLPMQVAALQALREGRREPALLYLETVASFSLDAMGQQRSKGANVPHTEQAEAAVRYLCANPPVIAGVTDKVPASVTKACAELAPAPGTRAPAAQGASPDASAPR